MGEISESIDMFSISNKKLKILLIVYLLFCFKFDSIKIYSYLGISLSGCQCTKRWDSFY